jgi:hypothetical protein
MDNKKKLREKLKKKRQERTSGATPEPPPEMDKEMDFVKMMDQVNQILKTNPEMVRQVSKCVSNVMSNPELMKSLAGQVGQDIQLDQTLDNNLVGEQLDASVNDPKQ